MTVEEAFKHADECLGYSGKGLQANTMIVLAAEARRLAEQNDALSLIADTAVSEMDGWQERFEAATLDTSMWKESYTGLNDGYDRLETEIERLRSAIEKINAIRNSIVGTQTVNWSAHVYPLVSALNEAGFHGQSYEDARKEAATLIEQRDAAVAERDRYKAALAESCDDMRAEGPYEGMGICPQLQEVTAQRDRYKAALVTIDKGDWTDDGGLYDIDEIVSEALRGES